MKQTPNMQLNKPEYSDVVDIEKLNENFDKIDNKITEVSGQIVSTVATTNKAGLMSASDKIKLDGIATGANKTTVDSVLSASSMNPVQNKVIKVALDGKADTNAATQTSSGLMAAIDKVKLDGISEGANKTIVDSAMSEASSNPVQNKVVKQYIDSKAFNGGSGSVTVDTNMSDTSTNPVQNKVIKAYVDGKSSRTTFDVWLTSTEPEYADGAYAFPCASDADYTELFNLAKNGAFIEGALYSGSDKGDRLSTLIFSSVSGEAGFGSLNFTCATPIDLQLANGLLGSVMHITFMDLGETAPTILLTGGAGYVPSPNSDNSDDGKSLVVNGHKWEMKKVDVVTDVATDSTNGLMSASDKAKLNGIATGATRTTVDRLLLDNSDNPVSNRVLKAALDAKAYKTVATAKADGLMSAADKEKLDSMYDIVATSTDGETFDITPAQLHEKLKGVPTACAIKVVDTIIPLHRVQLPGDGSTKYIFQITKDNGVWEPNTRLAYTASAGGTYAGTIWGKSEYDLLASTPGILKFTGAAKAQFSGSKDVTIDIPTGEGSVRYDETQELTSDQKYRASQNIGAVSQKHAFIDGVVMLQAIGHDDGASVVNITPSEKSNDYTLALDAGPENVPVCVSGIKTPTDAQTDCAANVEYVKNKISEVAASGGVDVDNALSATSTNPVQNKVIVSALASKASTATATQSTNGLMSKTDKAKLDSIATGATKVTVDSAMSGSSKNPVENNVIKQYVDDAIAGVGGGNITVDASLDANSENPIQNKAVKAALDNKADKTALDSKAGTATATTSANGLMSSSDKTKLDSIDYGATKIIVDSKLSSGSKNPVENYVIKAAIDNLENSKLSKSGGTLTGNLSGKYITGTWLQATDANDLGKNAGKIAVLDDSGWVYYRTPSELVADLGITNAIKSYVDSAITQTINNAY